MEITQDVRKQNMLYASNFTSVDIEAITFHKFANRPGYMLVIETRNVKGFQRFLEWLATEMERHDIEVIRTLPEEQSPFAEFEQKSLGFFNRVHTDFQVATEINDGRISQIKKDYEGGDSIYAI